jgi:hypothetical protein
MLQTAIDGASSPQHARFWTSDGNLQKKPIARKASARNFKMDLPYYQPLAFSTPENRLTVLYL